MSARKSNEEKVQARARALTAAMAERRRQQALAEVGAKCLELLQTTPPHAASWIGCVAEQTARSLGLLTDDDAKYCGYCASVESDEAKSCPVHPEKRPPTYGRSDDDEKPGNAHPDEWEKA